MNHPASALTGIRALDTPAIMVRSPGKVVLIAIANAGNRLVAVGEHGVIVYSGDDGATWRQAAVPVDVTLTTVRFANPLVGWAAGHYGVILKTTDGGLNWVEQLNGIEANELTVSAAQTAKATDPNSPGTPLASKRAGFFSSGGPDKPFLTMQVIDAQNVLIFGAYRMAMRTADGGRHWQDWSLKIGDAYSHNLYDAERVGPDIYVAGEAGMVLRSTDGGMTFPAVTPATDATLFAIVPAGDGGVVVCGVAGTTYRSADHGASWIALNLATGSSFTSGHALGSGAIVLTSESGNFYISYDNARTFLLLPQVEPMALYDFAQAADGDVVAVGSGGVALVPGASFLRRKAGE